MELQNQEEDNQQHKQFEVVEVELDKHKLVAVEVAEQLQPSGLMLVGELVGF